MVLDLAERLSDEPRLVARRLDADVGRQRLLDPLERERPLTLEAIARFPVVTYDASFTGRSAVDRSFAQRGLAPEIALTALDSDVIKSYASLGLGVGIVSATAYDKQKDRGLTLLPAAHLFPVQTTRVAFRRGARLRGFAMEFIRMFVPHLTSEALGRLVRGGGEDFEI